MVREVIKNPMVTLSFRVPLWRWENIQKGTTLQTFMVEWPDRSNSVKFTTAHLEFSKMHLKDHDKLDSLV
jgi:hypothetical protein